MELILWLILLISIIALVIRFAGDARSLLVEIMIWLILAAVILWLILLYLSR